MPPQHEWSDEELLHEALIAPRRAVVPMPDTVIEERPGWYSILTPSLRQGGLNEIASGALDGDVDAQIDTTLARYRAHGVRFRWTLVPSSTAHDLGERLAKRGLVETTSRLMWRATSCDVRTDVTVEEIDEKNIDELSRTLETGWGVDPGSLAPLHRRSVEHPARRQRFFLARRHDEPAGAAGYVSLDRSAYLVGGVVLPAHRQTGVYAALVHARLAHAHARGLEVATSIARESTSAPILAHLGFHTVCSISVYS